jgi:lauroyl/myristoyl acyltransferase
MEEGGTPLMRPHTERWAYRWLYAERVFRLCTALYPVCGRRVFHLVSCTVASLYGATQPAITEVVRSNLTLLGGAVGRKAAQRVFRNFARAIADYVAVGAMPEARAFELCGAFVGKHILEETVASGGGILATGHYGFFEFGTVVLGTLGFPLTVATLPEPSPGLTQWRARWRRKWGAETIEVGTDPFTSLGITQALSNGRLVGLLADRPMDGQGIEVPLPGGLTRFSITPAILGMATGRPIVPVVVAMQPNGLHRLTALPAIHAGRVAHGQRRDEVRRLTVALASALTSEFALSPEQWFQFVPVQCA